MHRIAIPLHKNDCQNDYITLTDIWYIVSIMCVAWGKSMVVKRYCVSSGGFWKRNAGRHNITRHSSRVWADGGRVNKPWAPSATITDISSSLPFYSHTVSPPANLQFSQWFSLSLPMSLSFFQSASYFFFFSLLLSNDEMVISKVR